MCRLFDDNDIDGFIDKTALEFGISSNTISELSSLRKLLNEYKEKETDVEIISDPEWRKIVKQAKVAIEEWNKA